MKKPLPKSYGQWAVVTGASDGIGRAFANELAGHGFNLVLVARRAQMLSDLAGNLSSSHGIKTHVLPLDVGSHDHIETLNQQIEALDVGLFVAAAGFGTSGNFGDTAVETELDMLDVNCRAVVAQTHYMTDRFKQSGRGAIVLISSLVGFQGTPRAAHYAATKAFIQSFAEAIRVELKPHNIDVLSVAPGPVQSGFAERARMNMGGADSPDAVARGALLSLGKRSTVRPGFLGKLLGYSLSLLPRWGRIQIMRAVMGGMTSHQHV